MMKRQRTLFDCGVTEKRHSSIQDSTCSGAVDSQSVVDSPDSSPTVQLMDFSTPPPPAENSTRPKDNSTPTDIAQNPENPPSQPVMNNQTTWVSGKNRSFSSNWYNKFSWLEYSIQKDAGFCYPCRLFAAGDSRLHGTFITSGFRNWKHATGKDGILTQHEHSPVHCGAMEAWMQYKLNVIHHTSIGERMNSERSQVILNNRHYLKNIIEVILVCAKQEIGLRGHRESEDDLNRGNFLEILSLVAAHDPVVQRKLTDGPQNAVYTSPEIQNSLLHIMGELVREKICAEVREAGVYSILVDETKDVSQVEQVAIVIRYVKKAVIYERFLTYVEASSLDAKSITEYIIGTLTKYQLDLQGIVSRPGI